MIKKSEVLSFVDAKGVVKQGVFRGQKLYGTVVVSFFGVKMVINGIK